MILERNEVLQSLSLASSHCATLASSNCMRSWLRCGTSRLALAHSKFVHHSTSSFMVIDSQDSPRILRPAGSDLEHHASRYTCGFLSLLLNFDQCARSWSSAHVPKASCIEAVHELHQHLRPFKMLRAQVRRGCLRRYLLYRQHVVADRLLEAQMPESRCASLCPTLFCLLCNRIGTTLPKSLANA